MDLVSDMDKTFCVRCKEEKKVVKTGKEGAADFSVLSCGHRSLAMTFKDSFKMSELFGFVKRGKTNIKHAQGDKPPNPNFAKKFIEYADIDYEAAVLLFDVQNRDYDFMNQAAFFCAQATEKYLKAFLFWRSPKHYLGLSGKQVLLELKKLSHNLSKILDECVKENPDFLKLNEQVKSIDRYSLLKYPDIEDEMIYSPLGLTIDSGVLGDVRQIGDFVKQLLTNEK